MNEVIKGENIRIEDMIYEVRGKQVMLDSDLAILYGVETKSLKRQVKRNINRFPENFCFELSKEEYREILRCQNGTLEFEKGKYSKYLPYVFTEQGVAMLAGVLHSDTAVNISIMIINAFVAMRHYIGNNAYRLSNVEFKVIEHDFEIKMLKKAFDKFEEKRKINEVYLSGSVYDAYSRIVDIFNEAKKELIIVDSYADKTLLDIVRKINVPVIIITKNSDRLSDLDIKKYGEEYGNLTVVRNNTYHDRYFVIDRKTIYNSGASVNNAGEKVFNINLMTDKFMIEALLVKLNIDI